MKIRCRFSLAVILVAVLVFLLTASAAYFRLYSTARAEVDYASRQMAGTVARSLADHFARLIDSFSIQLVDPKIEVLGENQQKTLLQQIFKSDQDLSAVTLIDKNGQVTNGLTRGEEGFSDNLIARSAAFYLEQIQEGKTYISPVEANNGQPQLVIAKPIINLEGQIIGGLVALVDLTPIRKSLDEFAGHGLTPYLLNEKGEIFLATVPERAPVLRPERTLISGVAWQVAVSEDETVNQKLFRENGFMALVVFLVSILFSLLLAFVLFRSTVKRFALVRQGVKISNGGNGKYKIKVPGTDEIAELAADLNERAEQNQ
jgi:methyl-accepting chemotaxis protein